jgi:hypothetical protein
VLVGDKKRILLDSSHVGILVNKLMVFEPGIEGVAVAFDQGNARIKKTTRQTESN